MDLFSQREGLRTVRDTFQIESVDEILRISLWNAIYKFYLIPDPILFNTNEITQFRIFLNNIWENLLERPLDEIHRKWPRNLDEIKEHFFSSIWYKVYDYLQYIASIDTNENRRESFIGDCNSRLEKEQSAYRFINGKIVKITSEEEIEEIEEALETDDRFGQVKTHINTALDLLSNRENPDFRNSIKESISAVESICRTLTGKSKFTPALKEIKKRIGLHPALEEAFKKLYGYTSDAEGIRHSLLDESNLVDYDIAKFMLVVCSAFINYIKSKFSES
ncbi:MAG: hypothetical protein QQN41_09910 [Nitrosopumilus sp.]